MADNDSINGELGRIFGPAARFSAPGRLDRLRFWFRSFIHPLGFHHPMKTFTYDKRLSRLIDDGRVCRVCGISCD